MASEVPEDDALEQSLSVNADGEDVSPDPEAAPDADALVQVSRKLERDPEVPDADALEQAETVPLDDDDRYGA